MEKRWDFNFFLKESKVLQERITYGKVFQSTGQWYLKVFSPKCVLTLGTDRVSLSSELLNGRLGTYNSV